MQNSPKKVFQHQHGCDVNADFVCLFEFSALFVRKQIIGKLFYLPILLYYVKIPTQYINRKVRSAYTCIFLCKILDNN